MADQHSGLGALRDIYSARGLYLDEDVKHNLETSSSADRALKRWLDIYASGANLLTGEELHFQQRTQPDSQASGRHVITDEAFDDAITALESSITGIDEQCKMLEDHKQALLAMRDQKSQVHRIELAKHNEQKTARELAQMELDTGSLIASTQAELQSHIGKIDNVLANAASTFARALEKDDRVIDGIQKIVPRLHIASDERLSSANIDDLCNHWISLERRAIRHHIDDTYEQALHEPLPTTNGHVSNVEAEERAVRAELDELRSEIDGLVALVAEHHYRGAIRWSLKQAQTDAEAESAKWSEYTACVLLYLASRLEAMYELFEHSHVHKAALQAVEEELQRVLVVEEKTDPKGARSPQASHGKGLRPLRLVQNSLSDTQDGTSQLFRLLDVKSLDNAEPHIAAQTLMSHGREKSETTLQHLDKTGKRLSSLLSASITSQDQHYQQLVQAVHLNTTTSQVQLIDEGLQAALKGLETRTDSLAAQMHALDIDELAKHINTQI